METRVVTQVKIFKLMLNHIEMTQPEQTELVAMSYDMQRMTNWIKEQRSETPYVDGGFTKVNRKNTPLEMYNDPTCNRHGVFEVWIEQEQLQVFLSTSSVHFIF